VAELYEKAILHNTPVDLTVIPDVITSTGVLAAYSGLKTGRSPKDKRIVRDETAENEIFLGEVNIPLPLSFKMLESRCIDYLNSRPRLYIVDGYAGWDPKYRIEVRVVSCRGYHANFMRNMLIVPTKEELERDFATSSEPDYHILNAGELNAGELYEGLGTKTSVSINFT
jgi:phosphoenolpyruvate carboxykinase (ATP)